MEKRRAPSAFAETYHGPILYLGLFSLFLGPVFAYVQLSSPEATLGPDGRLSLLHLSFFFHLLGIAAALRVRRALREGEVPGTTRMTAAAGGLLLLGIFAYWVLAAFYPVFFPGSY